MTDPKIKYDIQAEVTGQEDAADLARKLQEVSDVLGKNLANEARSAAEALRAVGDKQAALATFSSLKNEAGALSIELQEAQNALTQVQQRLDTAATATQGFIQAEMQARAALETKRQQLDQTRQALAEQQAGTTGAARKTEEYRASVDQARSTIQQLTAEIKLEGAALKQAQQQSQAATQAENALAAQRDAAAKVLADNSVKVNDNTAALTAAQAAAHKLGLDTASLSGEQATLANAMRGQSAVMADVKRAVDALSQSEQRASDIAREFQDNARKLGADGVQAPAALEQAFRQLGMGGLKPAQKALQELQIALAQIKASDVVDSQKQAAIQAFNQKVAELRGQATQAATATQGLGQAAQGAGTSLGEAAHKAAAWASALVGLQQLKGIAEQVVNTGAQFETLHIRLGNLLGSTEAATQAFGMLKQLAASTPFDVAGLTESFVKLTAFGMKPTEAQMRSLADIAANLGGGTEALQGVTLALGQAWTKTKLQGEEILQLAERGVPVWDALARATGRTVPELQRMSEAGLLGRDVIAKLIDELGRMNAGASDKLMHTYAGAVANAKDALAEFYDMVAKAGVLDWLTDKIRALLAEFERMKQTGELQEKAQAIADAFVQVADMADMATRALVQMAPAIKAAIEIWLVFKGLQLGQAFMSIATSAAGAATAVGAAGAASAGATGGLTAAAGAARGLAVALRAIPGAAVLWAVGEVVAALVGKFLGAKKAAEDADKAVTHALAERPASGAQQSAEGATQALTVTVDKAQDLIKQFDALKVKGEQADEALSKIGKNFDLSSAPGIRDAAVVLDDLRARGEITAQQFNQEWTKALKGVDLEDFSQRAHQAMDGTWEGVGRLEQAIDAGLREAVRRAGGEFDVLAGGMGAAAKSAVSDVDFIIANLDALKAKGVDTGTALSISLSKAIQTADSQQAIDALRARVEQLRKVLGDKITDGLLDQIKDKAAEVRDELEKSKPGVDGLRESMKLLGITSDETLKGTATKFKAAYEEMVATGKASQREISEGFKKTAEASIAANNGVADSWVKSNAAVAGYKVEVDGAGKATLVAMKDGKAATDAVGAAARNAGAGFASMADKVTMAKDALRAMGIEADQVSEKVQNLIANGQMLAGAFQQARDNWNRDLDQSQIKNRPGMNPVDAVPSFSTVEEADVWKERFLQKYARENPFSVKAGALGSFMRDLTLQEWAAEREAAETRTLMQEAKKPDSGGTPGGTPGGGSGGPRVDRIVNVYIGNSRAYSVPTNLTGQQNIEALAREVVRVLEQQRSQLGI